MTESRTHPPFLARAMLSAVVPRRDRRFFLSDMEEEFDELQYAKGERHARRWYWQQAFTSLWPSLRRSSPPPGPERRQRRNQNPIHGMPRALRFAVRSLIREPLLVFTTVLTLGLGVGATTVVFSVIRGVLLAPLPVADPGQVVVFNGARVDANDVALTDRDQVELKRLSEFRDVARVEVIAVKGAATGGGAAQTIHWASVTANFFGVLGVRPIFGADFPEEFDRRSVLVGHAFWAGRLGGAPDVVGRTVRLDNEDYTVVGVLPSEFRIPSLLATRRVDIWRAIPEVADSDDLWERNHVIGRLAAGVTLEQANRVVAAYARGSWERKPERSEEVFTIEVERLHDRMVGDVRPFLLVVTAAVVLVMLIASVSVASLMVVRAQRTRVETAVRIALGGSRGQVLMGMLTESLLLSLLVGAVGIVVAFVGIDVLIAAQPIDLPRIENVEPDLRMVGFGVVVAVATMLIFGGGPAWHASGVHPGTVLVQRAGGSEFHGTGVNGALVSIQIALTFVLLVGTGLLSKSTQAVRRVSLGFDPADAIAFTVNLPATYRPPERVVRFWREFENRVGDQPGVKAVGAIFPPVFSDLSFAGPFLAGAVAPNPDNPTIAEYFLVRPGYFDALAIRLLSGRQLRVEDDQSAVVIDGALAERYWPGRDPVGESIGIGYWLPEMVRGTVVGVVETAKHGGPLSEDPGSLYLNADAHGWSGSQEMLVVVRQSGPTAEVVGDIRRVLGELDDALPIDGVRSVATMVGDSWARTRFALGLMAVLAALALLVSLVGLYGLLSYVVSGRTREMGIRFAIGADRGKVVGLIAGQGLVLAAVGIIVGIGVSLGAMRVLETLLFNVNLVDLPVYVAATLGFAAASSLACLIPAVRAARLDPAVALREQ